jgi:hypothetical protein
VTPVACRNGTIRPASAARNASALAAISSARPGDITDFLSPARNMETLS